MGDFLKALYIRLRIWHIRTKFDFGNYLIATKRGLYQIKNKRLRLLLLGEFYGITICDHEVFVLQRLKHGSSHILRFPIVEENIMVNDKVVFKNGLNWGCHQIDYFDNHLYVMDTSKNRVIKISLSSDIVDDFYPLGKLENGRSSGNYAHMNSIYADSGNVYIMCHNDSVKTDRYSEIAVLDLDFEVQKIIRTRSRSAHNVAVLNNNFYYCDSLNATLKKDGKVLFRTSNFTRGLSISKRYIVVGGSEYAKRSKRRLSKGSIYFLNHRGELLDAFRLPGMAQEIRRLDKTDYGLSNTTSSAELMRPSIN